MANILWTCGRFLIICLNICGQCFVDVLSFQGTVAGMAEGNWIRRPRRGAAVLDLPPELSESSNTCQYWQLRPTPRAAPTRADQKNFLLCWPQDGSKLDFLACLVQFYAFTSDIKFFIPKKIDFLSIFCKFSGQHEAPNPPKIHLKSIKT